MLFFTGRVPEHGLEFQNEVVPVWVLELGAGRIAMVIDPKVFSTMGPPVLGAFGEEGGGANHHEGGDTAELVAERLKVGVAVT